MADMVIAWNDHLRDLQTPNTVYLSLLFLIGIGGNVLVLYVYTFKLKKFIDARYFIRVLALMDLIACVVSIPFYFTEMWYLVVFPSGDLCKFFYFTTTFSTGASAHVLFVIAIQRYLKICRPTGKQMTLKWKRISTGIAVIFTLIYATPLLYYSGIKEVSWTYQSENVTGVMCKMAARETGGSEFYYFALLSIVLVVNIIATVGMYVPIGYVIYKRFKSVKSRTQRNSTNRLQGNNQTESSETKQLTITSVDQTTQSNDGGKLPEKNPTAQTNTEGQLSEKTQASRQNTEGELSEKSLKKKQKQAGNVNVRTNFNRMFFAIILFYVISYIPTLVIIFLNQAFDNFWFRLSDSLFRFCTFLARLYTLNHAVNPIIYSFYDMKFRGELRRIFCSCTSRGREPNLSI